jgi:hypothetical protein
MARGGLKVKKGDRVRFRDGRSGVVYSTFPWLQGKTMVALAGADPNGPKTFLEDVVEVNGVAPSAPKEAAPALKKWAEGAPSSVAHRYTTHHVLAGAYAGRGKGGQQIGRGGEVTRSHAFIDGAQTSPCGISLNSASDIDEGTVPTCPRCAARVRALAAKASR